MPFNIIKKITSNRSRFCVGSRVQHKTLKEGRKTCWPKRCDYKNKVAVNRPDILCNNNHKV